MSGRRDSMDAVIQNSSMSSTDSLYTTSSSETSIDSLDFDRLSRHTKYIKFERYLKQLIKLGREVLARDHTYDRHGHFFLNTDRYLHIRDKVCDWIAHPDNAALFTDRDTYFYLAQMATTMHIVEIALALPHQPICWPGAVPGPDPHWPGVGKREVYRRFDELIHDRRELDTKAMPWNSREDLEMSD